VGTPLIALSEAKEYLRVFHTLEDNVITLLIDAATDSVQSALGYIIVEAQFEDVFQCFPPTERLFVDNGPVKSIDTISYLDVNGVAQTFDVAKVEPDLFTNNGVIQLKLNEEWPTTGDYLDPVKIKYNAVIPEVTKDIMIMIYKQLGDMYQRREDLPMTTPGSISQFARKKKTYRL